MSSPLCSNTYCVFTLLWKSGPRASWWIVQLVLTLCYSVILTFLRFNSEPRHSSNINYQSWNLLNCEQIPTSIYMPKYTIVDYGPLFMHQEILPDSFTVVKSSELPKAFVGLSDMGISIEMSNTYTLNRTLKQFTITVFPGSLEVRKFSPLRVEPKAFLFFDPWKSFIAQREELRSFFLCVLGKLATYPNLLQKLNMTVKGMPYKEDQFDPFYKVVMASLPLIITGSVLVVLLSLALAISSEEKNRTYLILKTVGYWRIWNTYSHVFIHLIQVVIILSLLFLPLWLAEVYFRRVLPPLTGAYLDLLTLWAISLLYGSCLIVMCAFFTVAFHPRGHLCFIIAIVTQPLIAAVIGSTAVGCNALLQWILPFFIPVMAFHNALIDRSGSFRGRGGYQDCYSLSLLEYYELYGRVTRPTVYYLLASLLIYNILLCVIETFYAYSEFNFEARSYQKEQRMICIPSHLNRPNVPSDQWRKGRRVNASVGTGKKGRSHIFKEVNIQPIDDEQELVAVMRDVSLTWCGIRVLDEFSIKLQASTVTGLISTSPHFFSTFISALTCAARSYTGSIQFLEQDTVVKPVPRVSVCTADPIIFDDLSVIDNFRLLSCQTNTDLNVTLQSLMARIGLLPLISCKIKTLTKGQKKLTAIAIALSSTSKVAILEEPLRGLTLEDVPKVLQLIYIGKSRRSIVILTSNPKLAGMCSQRVALESRGRVILEGTSAFLKRKFRLDFSLHITKSPHFRLADVYEAVEELTGPLVAARGDSMNSKLLFQLSRPEIVKLEKLNNLLTSKMKILKISRFALAETSVEDMLHVLKSPVDVRRSEVEGTGKQQTQDLRKWIRLHRCTDRPRFAYQNFLIMFLSCVYQLWLRMVRASVPRGILALLVCVTVYYCSGYIWLQSRDAFTVYPYTSYCSKGSSRFLDNFEAQVNRVQRHPWRDHDSFKTRRHKYRFCISDKTDRNNSDDITVYYDPNDPAWLELVLPTVMNIEMAKRGLDDRYDLVVHESMLDHIRNYLTWVPDSHHMYNMLVVGVLMVNSFYFVLVNHTPFVTRHLFHSGLSKIAYFLALYVTLLAINIVGVTACIVAPLCITSLVPSSILIYRTSFRSHLVDFFLLIVVASSQVTLLSICIGIWLPKSTSFLHLLVYMFCSKAMVASLLLYHMPTTNLTLWLVGFFSPGSTVGIFAHFVYREQKIDTVCFNEIVSENACIYNPYSVRPCCEEVITCRWGDHPGSLCYGTELHQAAWAMILSQLWLIPPIALWYNNSWLVCRNPTQRKQIKEMAELRRKVYDVLTAELVLTKYNLHETLLRENAQLNKGVFQRLLKPGSVVIKDACVDAENPKRSINLVIHPNSCCGVLGLPRSGKSTILKIIRGEREVEFGEVRVNGLRNCDPSRIGYYSKCIEFPEVLQPIELFLIQATIRKQPYAYRMAAVLALAAVFGLVDKLEEKMASLTTGERRLVSLMSAFVGKPDIVLLDEPTAEMDAPTRETIWNAISLIKPNCTLVVATDTLDDFERIGFDKVVVMANLDMKMILSRKELEAQVCRGYSLTVKVHVTSDAKVYQSFTSRRGSRSQDLMGPIREWILLRLPKAVSAIDAGGLLEMHVVGESTSVTELFLLRDFLCKQFKYISEFRITHLSNRDKLRHLIGLANKYSAIGPVTPLSSLAPVDTSLEYQNEII